MDRSTIPAGLTSPWGSYSESSSNTPGFHALVQKGLRLPLHDYSWRRVDGTCFGRNCDGSSRVTAGVDYISQSWESGEISPPLSVYRIGPVDSNSLLVSMLTNKLNAKLRNRDIDLGVSLGEYRETARFVSNAVVKVVKSYRQLRKGNTSDAMTTLTGNRGNRWRDVPGASSDAWLAYSYGLRPLLSDVYGACDALEKANRKPRDLMEIRARVSSSTLVNSDMVLPFLLSRKVVFVGSRVVTGAFRYRVNNPVLSSLDSLGVLNPLSVAWELVPFSFVVDWFIPVGKFITDVVPPQGLDFVDGYTYLKGSGIFSVRFEQPANINCSLGQLNGEEVRSVVKRRAVLHDFPRYSLRVPDLSLSKGQMASAMSLMHQQAAGASSSSQRFDAKVESALQATRGLFRSQSGRVWR
jgi:hypothetical protein